ncbi:Zeaxanthin epoxidase, chloroplastic [Glycine soja]|nr:Zeaxanthin epoxidase, chloroplastic [Glycine soja]
MASTLSCNSFNHSMAVFSKSHFSILMYKELSLDISPCVSYGSRTTKQRKTLMQIKATVAEEPPGVWKTVVVSENGGGGDGAPQKKKKLKVLVAGGGIGGGPIQIQSNALAALEAIDLEVAEEVMRAGCITDDRINGLVDGISGSWYIKFDTFTPAAERGLPVTRVISRMTLQEILARAVGEDVIMNDSNVVDFVDHGGKVTVELENVQKYDGDLLVGADGIWSKVRKKLFGQTEATYSGYTCYTGIADFVPADIESVGYERERRLRVAIVHGMARMAAMMASTYKAYLGVGLGPLEANGQLHRWFEANNALERAINGEWILLPCGDEAGTTKPICLSQDEIKPCTIGFLKVSQIHARINYKDGAFFLTDLRSQHGTWITDNEGRRYKVPPNYPARVRPSDVIEFGSDKVIDYPYRKNTFNIYILYI